MDAGSRPARARGLPRRDRARRADPLPRLGRSGRGRGDRASPVLLVHGLNATAWAWTAVARRLREVGPRPSRSTCADTASPMRRHPATRRSSSARTWWPWPRARACCPGRPTGSSSPATATGRSWRPGPPAALGEPLRGTRPRRRRLAGPRRGDRHDARRVASRARGAARDLQLDGAYLADRRDFDPASWDADQEQAARSTVVEVPRRQGGPGGPAARPRGLGRGDVHLRPAGDPGGTWRSPVAVLLAATEDGAGRRAALDAIDRARAAASLDPTSADRPLERGPQPAPLPARPRSSRGDPGASPGNQPAADAVIRLSRSSGIGQGSF